MEYLLWVVDVTCNTPNTVNKQNHIYVIGCFDLGQIAVHVK